MSFDQYNNDTVRLTGKSVEICKPDYELQAATMKLRLDAIDDLQKSLLAFADINGLYAFKDISSCAEFIGGLTLMKHDKEKQYEELLSHIEN